jgi:hypothetical protein
MFFLSSNKVNKTMSDDELKVPLLINSVLSRVADRVSSEACFVSCFSKDETKLAVSRNFALKRNEQFRVFRHFFYTPRKSPLCMFLNWYPDPETCVP